jgi:XTP/dITP diphosphohydrolase
VTRLLVGTTNAGKQREFRRLLAGVAAEVVTPDQIGLDLTVEEPHHTYAENATAKADAFCRASGLVTLADDSGIEIAALDWGPGVRSARWGSGRGSQASEVAERLRGADDRRARMVCVVAIAVPSPGAGTPAIHIFDGVIEGSVADEPRGEGGFGYDPIFLLPGGRTTAELPEGEKDRISHRGRAVASAAPFLAKVLAGG